MMTRVAFVEGDRERKGKKGERRRERRREKEREGDSKFDTIRRVLHAKVMGAVSS